jgi:hypothetical protein
VEQGFFGRDRVCAAAVGKALGSFEEIFASLVGGNASFDSCHSCKIKDLRLKFQTLGLAT